MAHHALTTPLDEAAIRRLAAGDTVTLDGIVFGLRDATLIRICDRGVPPPVELRGAAILHTAPNVRKVGDRYEKVSIGTTTSMRMDRFTPALVGEYGVRAILGKGGLSAASLRALQQHGACYLALVGGAAALETLQVEEIEAVYWEDLMPECLWQFRVKALGPLFVAMDAHGRSLFGDVEAASRARLKDIFGKLGIPET